MTGLLMGLWAGLIKIGMQIAFAFVTAIPLTIAWNNIAPLYFAKYLPSQLLHFPFLHVMGLLLIISFIGECVQHITPKLVSINQEKSTKGGN